MLRFVFPVDRDYSIDHICSADKNCRIDNCIPTSTQEQSFYHWIAASELHLNPSGRIPFRGGKHIVVYKSNIDIMSYVVSGHDGASYN